MLVSVVACAQDANCGTVQAVLQTQLSNSTRAWMKACVQNMHISSTLTALSILLGLGPATAATASFQAKFMAVTSSSCCAYTQSLCPRACLLQATTQHRVQVSDIVGSGQWADGTTHQYLCKNVAVHSCIRLVTMCALASGMPLELQAVHVALSC